MNDFNSLVSSIKRDLLEAKPYHPYATETPRTIEEAYRLQDALAAELVNSGSRGPVAGWKIAANSPPLLARFGLEEPLSGRVFADQNFDSPARLKMAHYREFALEPEIAAIIGQTLDPAEAPFDRDRIARSIDRFVPAIELLDMRETDMKSVHIPDVIAQNISNAGAVLGGPGLSFEALDADHVRTEVSIDDKVVDDVTGGAPQPPAEAVMWLANHLALRGKTLQAGQFVLCGTHCGMRYHGAKEDIHVEMSGLGSVTVSCE